MPPKKKVAGLIKLQIQAGAATPAPPVGPALGQHGVNIMDFCKAYNAATESQRGNIVPVEITVYEDRSFDFITKTPPAARLILKRSIDRAFGIQAGPAWLLPLRDLLSFAVFVNSLFGETVRMAQVDSISPSIVWALSRPRLDEMLAGQPELAYEILRAAGAVMAERMRGTLERGTPVA